MGAFTVQLQQFADKVKDKSDGVVRACVFNAYTRIDNRSPVGNPTLWKNPAPKGYVGGRFRGEWQYGNGSIPAGVTGRIDPTGEATRGAIFAEIPTQAAGKTHFIVNNMPYGEELENGRSTQAPQGMVGLTVVEWPQIVEGAVAGQAK